jgi:putative sigma-54 modulation protein
VDLDLTFRNLEPTDAIKLWAAKRFQKVVKHLREPASAHLVLTVDRHRHRAELTVHSGSDVLRAEDESADMYASMDAVMARVAESAHRAKERQSRSWQL